MKKRLHKTLVPALLAILLSACASVQKQYIDYFSSAEYIFHERPEDVELIWEDSDAFWQAVDASRQTDGSFGKEIFEKTYLANKSGDIDAYAKIFYGSEEGLYQNHHLIPFYESFRDVLTDKSVFDKETYVSYLKKLQEYYPAAKFPNLYLSIGHLRQGGTAIPPGIWVGLEILQKDVAADYSRLPWPEDKIERTKLIFRSQDRKYISSLVMHEVMHFEQQLIAKDSVEAFFNRDLLHYSLIEGSAEFLTYVVTEHASFSKEQREYGLADETAL
ncbi:MAG: hypothetical protein AAF975_04110, partial [Spirochaetota bacterium]